MNRLILLGLLSLTASFAVRGQDPSTVIWGRPIAYQDFQAAPAKEDTAAANISVTIVLGYAAGSDDHLTFNVFAAMDKQESWIREGFKNEVILKHEQGHFDIAHVYARKLDADLKRKRYRKQDLAQLNNLYDHYLGLMNELQLRYDRETRGGLNALAQSKWRNYIRKELASVGR